MKDYLFYFKESELYVQWENEVSLKCDYLLATHVVAKFSKKEMELLNKIKSWPFKVTVDGVIEVREIRHSYCIYCNECFETPQCSSLMAHIVYDPPNVLFPTIEIPY